MFPTISRPQSLIVAVVVLATAIAISLTLPVFLDEFTYAHASWLISRGEVPYRDFALFHPPLVEYFLAPVFWLTDDISQAVNLMRMIMALIAVASLAVLERLSRVTPGLVSGLALTSSLYSTYAFQIRPDALAVPLVIFSAGCMLARSPLSAGLFLGLAGFCSEKALVFGAAILLGAEANIRMRIFLSGALVAALLYGVLALQAGFTMSWHFLVDWTLEHLQNYPRITAWSQIKSQILQLLLLVSLASYGFLRGVVPNRRFWILFFLCGLASYFAQNAAFAYSALPFLPPLFLLAARGFAQIELVRRSSFVSCFVVMCLLATGVFSADRRDAEWRQQVELFENIEKLVPPKSCVYDSTGMAIARPHAAFYFFVDAKINQMLSNNLETALEELIERNHCIAMIRDPRLDFRSPEFRSWLENRFPNCRGALCLMKIDQGDADSHK